MENTVLNKISVMLAMLVEITEQYDAMNSEFPAFFGECALVPATEKEKLLDCLEALVQKAQDIQLIYEKFVSLKKAIKDLKLEIIDNKTNLPGKDNYDLQMEELDKVWISAGELEALVVSLYSKVMALSEDLNARFSKELQAEELKKEEK